MNLFPERNIYIMYKKSFIALGALLMATGAIAQNSLKITPQQKLLMAEKVISSYYVDTVSQNDLVEAAIKGMLGTLDPHSVYTNAEETRDLTTDLNGNFSGIGISFNMVNDSLYVISTISGGPSEKVGIHPGDRIISAGDSIISGVNRRRSSVMTLLRGERGTKVRLKVVRKGEPEPLEFIVTRDNIPVESVAAVFMAEPGIGYIKLSRFAETSDQEVHKAIETLRRQGMRSLILDLTDNTGGHMKSAIEIAGEFLPRKSVIVSTRAPKFKQTIEYEAEHGGNMNDGRLVILVNQFSASASEIVSGAIQDYDRGVIVGRRTFGKGLVQRPFPLPDGSMIRVTISRYYTPTGRSIQKPYTKGKTEDYDKDMIERYEAGEFFSADSVHLDKSALYKTLNNKRDIYGGGGIMPDIFVPADTTYSTPLLRDLVAKNILLTYAQEYTDINRDIIKEKYPDDDSYINGFHVSGEMISALLSKAEKSGIIINEGQLDRSIEIINANIKAIIGRNIYSPYTLYRVMAPYDPIYRKGLEVIKSDEIYPSVLKSVTK